MIDVRQYYEIVALPNLREALQNPADMRAAVNALLSIDALAGRIYYAVSGQRPLGASDDSTYREALARQEPDFALFRDAAKALKHVLLTRGTPRITKASDARVETPGFDQALWGEFGFDAEEQVVLVETAGSDEVFRPAGIIAQRALELLADEMTRLGV